jgi:hypothetical protein
VTADDLHLFDPDEYTANGATPRAKRTVVRRSPEIVPVVVDDVWRFVHGRTGIVHAAQGAAREVVIGSGRPGAIISGTFVSYCGVIVSGRTYSNGQIVNGCGVCLDRGAPRAAAERAAAVNE